MGENEEKPIVEKKAVKKPVMIDEAIQLDEKKFNERLEKFIKSGKYELRKAILIYSSKTGDLKRLIITKEVIAEEKV